MCMCVCVYVCVCVRVCVCHGECVCVGGWVGGGWEGVWVTSFTIADLTFCTTCCTTSTTCCTTCFCCSCENQTEWFLARYSNCFCPFFYTFVFPKSIFSFWPSKYAFVSLHWLIICLVRHYLIYTGKNVKWIFCPTHLTTDICMTFSFFNDLKSISCWLLYQL